MCDILAANAQSTCPSAGVWRGMALPASPDTPYVPGPICSAETQRGDICNLSQGPGTSTGPS